MALKVLGVERRRRWSVEAKAAIVAEASRPGGSVSLTARRHGRHPNQVFTWRRQLRDGAGPPAMFAAVQVTPAAASDGRSIIEVELPSGVRVRVDRSVNEAALRLVLSALGAS